MPFSERLWAMADLFTPMAVRVAATLSLADHVAAGAGTIPELAERTGADPDALGRLVEHLVTAGVLERSTGALALTELGDDLRGDGAAWLDIEGAVGRGDLSALHLLDSIRTGRPAYPETYGRGFWEDIEADPALGRSYDALMSSRTEVPEVVAGYDWGSLGHIVDVGGGTGTLLAATLVAHPGLRGTLVDLPGAAEAARRTFAEAGVADRCEAVAGSAFDPLPAGAGAYVLSAVLHGFDDVQAVAMLRRCAEAAGADGRVLIVEDDGGSTEMDLRMLAYTGGRERTPADFERLAADAGLRVTGAHRVARYRAIVELRA